MKILEFLLSIVEESSNLISVVVISIFIKKKQLI